MIRVVYQKIFFSFFLLMLLPPSFMSYSQKVRQLSNIMSMDSNIYSKWKPRCRPNPSIKVKVISDVWLYLVGKDMDLWCVCMGRYFLLLMTWNIMQRQPWIFFKYMYSSLAKSIIWSQPIRARMSNSKPVGRILQVLCVHYCWTGED